MVYPRCTAGILFLLYYQNIVAANDDFPKFREVIPLINAQNPYLDSSDLGSPRIAGLRRAALVYRAVSRGYTRGIPGGIPGGVLGDIPGGYRGVYAAIYHRSTRPLVS